ncbi:MAG: hypothetical protein SCK57_07995 [Bacillota bacterium]|nr:hypothetical protein [Bacillota bacterium]MDW7677587.1 hypothetical protein [Bacillota bacterium]
MIYERNKVEINKSHSVLGTIIAIMLSVSSFISYNVMVVEQQMVSMESEQEMILEVAHEGKEANIEKMEAECIEEITASYRSPDQQVQSASEIIRMFIRRLNR